MPYSVPTPPPSSLSATPAGSPPAHMRSLSTQAVPSYSFTSERGPGAFASLGSLPRRGPAPSLTGNPRATSATAKRFHIKSSSDDSTSSSSDDDDDNLPVRRTNLRKFVYDDDTSLPALKLRTDRLGTPTFDGVPFPRSSPLSSPLPGASSPLPSPTRTPSGLLSPLSGINSPTVEMSGLPTSTELPITASNPIYSPYKYSPQDGTTPLPLRPSPTRSSSSPHMYLSNGRPLKSSLKSSSSSSSIHAHTSHSHHMRHMHSNHQRASSAPTTPRHGLGDDDSSPSSPATNSPSDSGTSSPTTPKSVHFPSLPTHLERVRVFHKSAKPASLLTVRAQEDDTETETETERDRGDWGYRGGNTARMSGAFPFPKISTSSLPTSNNATWPLSPPVASKGSSSTRLELDMTGYPVPNPTTFPPKPDTHILLESISSSAFEDKMHVQGNFIVRNLAFQKEVGVRFTMDQWRTVSEVKANWVANFPSPFPAQRSSIKEETDTWDRFSFSINLSDYPMASLPSKVIYFVGRYTVPGAEYWDNCGGRNWRVRFKVANGGVENPSLSSSSSKMPLNIVVSPPTVSAPTPSMDFATAASPTSATPLLAPPAPNTAPAVVTGHSPVRFEALAHATAQRLRRFSLSNYVAPGTSVPPVAQVKTAEELAANPKASSLSAQSQESSDGAKPSLRPPLSIVTTPSNEISSSAVSPPSNSSSPSMLSSSSLLTPPAEGSSDSLYDWFVQQWCFAGPSGMPDQNWKRNELGNNTPPSRGSLGLEIEG